MLHLILQKNHDFLINMIQQVIPSPVFRVDWPHESPDSWYHLS